MTMSLRQDFVMHVFMVYFDSVAKYCVLLSLLTYCLCWLIVFAEKLDEVQNKSDSADVLSKVKLHIIEKMISTKTDIIQQLATDSGSDTNEELPSSLTRPAYPDITGA